MPNDSQTQSRREPDTTADDRTAVPQVDRVSSRDDDRDLESGSFPKTKSDSTTEKSSAPLPFTERAVRVTWAWFPCTMSTGALASLINVQPFEFPGLTTIGKIFYILNLILFVTFSTLIVIRFIKKPLALSTSLHHPSESFFFGSFWVSIALIINGAQGYGVPESGPWLVSALKVLFWIYIACALIVAVFEYHVIFEVEKLSLSDAVPAWILPAYPFLVTGTVAANIAETQPDGSALQIIVAGLMGQGLGWILALFVYVVYLTRLIANDMPPPSTRPGMYVSVGPAAYTCAGLVGLGKQAQTVLPDGFLGVTSLQVGDVWRSCSVAAALFLWLIALWFSCLTTVSIFRVMKRMNFTLQWWAFVFPNAGLAIATIQLGDSLDSFGLKAFGAAITVVLVALWLLCAFCHLRALWNRELLAVGKDMGVEEVNNTHDEKKIDRRRKTERGFT
ncbi:malic acid transport protein [Plectosphaerella cucumerina]|uniref:Malic acid transport protein n=1 Tax=Plectosphaerella cucumerina TaxID=40658 RepID=A0A8K0TLI6_9PEZI|nr:malic acid transport protein [Plectosphaerella cucumerina]